jgi:hypothetical protein
MGRAAQGHRESAWRDAASEIIFCEWGTDKTKS